MIAGEMKSYTIKSEGEEKDSVCAMCKICIYCQRW